VIRRKTNRRHMTGDHHGRAATRATLLVRAADEILGTHNRKCSGASAITTAVARLKPARNPDTFVTVLIHGSSLVSWRRAVWPRA
jgi:hypothetical protein